MTLLDTEATVEIRNLLIDNWDVSNIGQPFDTAWISTGWWDEETPNPQITLTEVSENTSPDAIVPDGSGLSSWVDGQIQCDVWVPYDRENYSSQGVAKDFRWDLIREVHRIVENNQQGESTTDLNRIETGDIQRDPVEEPPPFRALIPIGLQYRTAPE